MRKVSLSGVSLAVSLFPALAFAQTANFDYATNFLGGVISVLGLLTPIIFAIAILYFFWGLAKFVMAAGDEEARAQGKSIMLWGIVALFVMVSVYGLVQILQNISGINKNATINLPGIPGSTADGAGPGAGPGGTRF